MDQEVTSITPTVAAARELRLDFFRGLALWLIFLDHIPYNVVSRLTLHNFGFSDAAEIFVFISGYTAAFVYGRAMLQRGFIVATARILRRVWQIYIAHVFLFVIFLAEIGYVSETFDNPLYREETGIFDFIKQPDISLVQALLLKFKPVNMDILPLYIVLLLGFPPVLWVLLRWRTLGLLVSGLLYALTWHFGWNLPSYPSGGWYFNPLAWQLLFVFGAWCALGGAKSLEPLLRSRTVLVLAVAYLVFGLWIAMTWSLPQLAAHVPKFISESIYPLDKTNMDAFRFAHFLALVLLVVRFVPRDWRGLRSPLAWPIIVCGQHSLEVFCLGVFLSFAAHFVFTELSDRVTMQILVCIAGLVLMTAAASLISWYKAVEGRTSTSRAKPPDADLAAGEA